MLDLDILYLLLNKMTVNDAKIIKICFATHMTNMKCAIEQCTYIETVPVTRRGA